MRGGRNTSVHLGSRVKTTGQGGTSSQGGWVMCDGLQRPLIPELPADPSPESTSHGNLTPLAPCTDPYKADRLGAHEPQCMDPYFMTAQPPNPASCKHLEGTPRELTQEG